MGPVQAGKAHGSCQINGVDPVEKLTILSTEPISAIVAFWQDTTQLGGKHTSVS